MSNTLLKGNVSFVNHEKHYLMIEYSVNAKKKVINGSFADKSHFFNIGDTVSFTAGLSDRGDKMVASDIEYLYNEALDVLLNKAKTLNQFTGYLKAAGSKYFVKEVDSYLFIEVPLSPWQLPPTEASLNEPLSFMLEHLGKKERVKAKLFDNKYIPEFYTAVKLHKAGTVIEAEIYNISPYGIYVNVIGDAIKAKLPIDKNAPGTFKVGDKVKVLISFLSPFRIVVERTL